MERPGGPDSLRLILPPKDSILSPEILCPAAPDIEGQRFTDANRRLRQSAAAAPAADRPAQPGSFSTAGIPGGPAFRSGRLPVGIAQANAWQGPA